MAAKPIPKEKIDKILAEWRTGSYSQRDLADKHKVSAGMVAKLTKGIDKDCERIVSAGVAYNQGLSGHDEQTVSAITMAVEERSRYIKFFNDAALTNTKRALSLPCETQQDHERLSNTILRSKEVVLGKQPDTAIQVNNTPQDDGKIKFYIPSNGRD